MVKVSVDECEADESEAGVHHAHTFTFMPTGNLSAASPPTSMGENQRTQRKLGDTGEPGKLCFITGILSEIHLTFEYILLK